MSPSRDHGTDRDISSSAFCWTRRLAHEVGNPSRSLGLIPHASYQGGCSLQTRSRTDGYHIRDTCSDTGFSEIRKTRIRRGR